MSLPDSITALPKRADDLRALLTKWCNQNSGSENLAGLAAMLELLHADFAKLPGAKLERVNLEAGSSVPPDRRTNGPASLGAQALRVRVRPAAPLQIFLSGHYDTVYGPAHPFQKCDQPAPDKLRGPGTSDMKGGLVVMLAALQAFEKTPEAAKLGYEILLGPDEETGSQGSAPVLEEAAKRHRFGLVFEPARANGDLVKSRKGTGIFTLTCHGRAAHAGRDPAAGRNAILALCEILPPIAELIDELPGVMVNLGAIKGGGTANIVPDFAEAVINARVTRAGDDVLFLKRLHEICAPLHARDGYRLEIGGGFNRTPKVETPFEVAVFADWQKCGRDLGLNFNWQHVGGGSDGNILAAAGLPNLDGLGCVGDHLHSPEEFCHVPSLGQRAQVAALFLHRLATGEIALPRKN
ncbi:MAG: cpg2 [Lacunisphaera sp.]|nr:cpg2 [Lacunisphaera sp.]